MSKAEIIRVLEAFMDELIRERFNNDCHDAAVALEAVSSALRNTIWTIKNPESGDV